MPAQFKVLHKNHEVSSHISTIFITQLPHGVDKCANISFSSSLSTYKKRQSKQRKKKNNGKINSSVEELSRGPFCFHTCRVEEEPRKQLRTDPGLIHQGVGLYKYNKNAVVFHPKRKGIKTPLFLIKKEKHPISPKKNPKKPQNLRLKKKSNQKHLSLTD